jgi:tetratricopeptide (TPR) repeat protein
MGALAALALPLHLALATLERRRIARLAWGLAAAAALAALILSRSTAAFAAALAGVAIWAAGGLAARMGVRRDLAAGGLACALIVASAAAPLLLARGDLAERSGWSQAARAMEAGSETYKDSPRFHWRRLVLLAQGRPDANVASRLRYGRATLEALRDGPLFGFGPGSVPLTFARYRLQVPGASPWGEAVGQLHSASLQRVYEGGFAGAAAFTAWVLLSVLGLPVADPAWARMRAGMAAGAGALAVAGLADALEGGPLLVGLAVATLALLAARPEARASERLPRPLLAGLGALAALAALAGGIDAAREGVAHRRADRAVERVGRDGFGPAVLEDLLAAARIDPLVGLYEHQAAYAAEEMALAEERAGRLEAAQSLFQQAERLYLRAAERLPDVPGFASQAGNFLLDRDRPREAIAHLRRAVALDYYDPLGHFYLGEALRLAGDEESAIEAQARSLRYYPRLAGAALYQAAGNEALRRRVLERTQRLLIAEGAQPASGTPAGRLKRFVEEELARSGPGEGAKGPPVVLVHRFDQVAGKSRAWHLFGRRGFTMENLPVTVLEAGGAYDEGRWARVLEGLPTLTAARLNVSERGGSTPPSEHPVRRHVRCCLPAPVAIGEVNG